MYLKDCLVFENDDFIALNKPSGLLSIPDREGKEPSLKSLLQEKYGHIFTVHRLDKDTSGVMVVAKTDVAQLALGRQLQAKRFAKEYLALVWGDPGDSATVIEAPLLRDAEDRRRVVVRAGGRDAVTRFERIATWGGGNDRTALLHVEPVTGRTHQIRVHLAYAHFPIVGDPVYGRRGDTSGLSRQFLHAWRLTVRLPHAGERTFTAPLAPDLVVYLEHLGTPSSRTPLFAEVS